MRPLKGKRVVITRPREKAEGLAQGLEALGAIPVVFPTIAINPLQDTSFLDRALRNLDSYRWLVFTSANAVSAVWKRLRMLEIDRLPPYLKIAAVGQKTADSIEGYGVRPDFIPGEFISEAIVLGLGDLGGCQVLLPSADIAHDTLPNAIQAAGGLPHVVTAYYTIPAQTDPEGLHALRGGVDVLTFTSGSTARNFVNLLQEVGLDPFNLPGLPAVAVIGPKTAREAREVGFVVDIVAKEYTVEGLLVAITGYFREEIADEPIS